MKRLQDEWEKTLFWVMVVALLGTLAFWAFHSSEGGSKAADNKMKTRESFLGQTPYAFLDDAAVERLPSNPFSFGYKPEQNRPWRKPEVAATDPAKPPPAAATQPTKPTVAKVPPTTQTVPAEPAEPAAPPPARILAYRGYLEGTSGTLVAFVNVTDPATKKSSMVQLAVGRKIDGIEVKDFTGDMLQVIDPQGKPVQVARGSRKKIVLE